MRTTWLLLAGIIVQTSVAGQNTLSSSRRTSVHTYIYKISEKEAYTLYKSGLSKANEKYLHSLIDSFKQDKEDIPKLNAGNYLQVYAKDNQLAIELLNEGDVNCKLIDNNRDFFVALHTKEGKMIDDARVYFGRSKVNFDQRLQSYKIPGFRRTGLLRVYKNNAVYFFPVAKNRSGRNFQLQYRSPFKYVIQPVKKLFAKKNYNNYFWATAHEKRFRGFMVFNKPKYKPGDTVYFKAFIQTKKGKAIKNKLLLRLTSRYFSVDTVLAKLLPYIKGGYEYKFVLNDSLDIDLDDEYLLTLEELRSEKYNLDTYEGDLDEGDYASKRKVVMRGKFLVEDYELGAISFFARADKKEHRRSEAASVYLRATDENELAVLDGRVQVLVQPSASGNQEFHAQKVFLPDTLWYHEQNLEQIGETKIVLPDSIFPQANLSYEVRCVFLNSNNESQTKTLYQRYYDEEESIVFTAEGDSLKIEWMVHGKSTSTRADLYVYGDDSYEDTMEKKLIALPATVRINPFAKIYEVETENQYEEFEIRPNKGMVSCLALRTRDSITVQMINPHGLKVWYTILAGNRVIRNGVATDLLFKDVVRTNKNYFVSLQYVFANTVLNEHYTVPYQDKLLTIQTNQPQFVYPGQTVQIDIDVKNASGKAVPGADVTAWGFTKKFREAKTPAVPYFGKMYPLRKYKASMSPANDEAELDGTIKLNWKRWSMEMRLDTIEYFKFLHPKDFYVNTEAATDSITQIAPFVVVNGDLQPIHQLYIDEKPVFFSQAQHLRRYSFRVSPGKHSFRLRTHNRMIWLDSFTISKGVKTFLSINADSSNKKIRLEKMPDSLTNYEKNLWSRYMILMENNFGESFAYLRQNENIYFLNSDNRFWASPILTGPFSNQHSNLVVKNGFAQGFEVEGAYQYQISQGLIKQKQLRSPYPFRSFLSPTTPGYNFADFVLTENEIDGLWEKYLEHRSINEDLFQYVSLDKKNNGGLRIGVTKHPENDSIIIKNILLFKNTNPDFIRAYKGAERHLGYIQPGNYRLFFLLKDDRYFIKDSIEIVMNGMNYYETGLIVPNPKDSISIRISDIIKNLSRGYNNSRSPQMDAIKELFNEKYLPDSSFNRVISGTITDDKGKAIAGAMVMIKGTRTATLTDAYGNFIVKAPEEGSLVISSVGFSSQEVRINNAIDSYTWSLVPYKNFLEEVIVVGYGTQRRSNLTASASVITSSLSGNVPGLIAGGSTGSIRIRGASLVEYDKRALIIVDGIPVSGNTLEQLDPNSFEKVEILRAEVATGIYGSQAINGVVLITTKKGVLKSSIPNADDLPLTGNSLRKNFSDYAYWQPMLKTDENGKAFFKVTFPDDITNWRTFVIAADNKRQTGFAEGNIRSFKAISGNMALPQFAVAGDSIHVIGKSLNYQTDSVIAKRTFYVNDVLQNDNRIGFKNAWIDTFLVVTLSDDSLKLKYTIEKENGYFDGEERSIPVLPQGVLETSGFFTALTKDTSFTLRFNDTATIKLYAETSLLPVWENEIERIRRYEYLCNEQLASKLKALLLQKKIDGYMKREFSGEKIILDLISRLNQNKETSGLWGWWKNTEPAVWISLHVAEALLQAEKMGYKVTINKPILVDYLIYNLESYNGTEKLSALNLLWLLGAKADFRKYMDTLEMKSSSMSMHEKLRLAELKQKTGHSVSLDTLLRKQNHTAFGNIYWGEDSYRFFDNAVQNTLVMYRLLRTETGYEDLLLRIRNYFLEKRNTGHWRNTYESALILETILPDLLVNDSLPGVPLFHISNQAITKFPYTSEIKGPQNVLIKKNGVLPVYFTAYQQRWNALPQRVAGNFEVRSFYEHNGEVKTKLKAGEPVLLRVNVSVLADAEYVMIEVPVPAGCSYKDKAQSYRNNEVHREYFKHKVSIFCSFLRKGDYTFTVSLLPRFTGNFTLNPAKAEMMYFPVYYGREALKKIEIL